MPIPGMRRVTIEVDGAQFHSSLGFAGEEIDLLHELENRLGLESEDCAHLWSWWVESKFRGGPWTKVDWPETPS